MFHLPKNSSHPTRPDGQSNHRHLPLHLNLHLNNYNHSQSHPCLPATANFHHKQSASIPPRLDQVHQPNSPPWSTNYDDEADDDCPPVRARPEPTHPHPARPRRVLHKMLSSVALSVRSSHESARTHTRSHSRGSTLLGAPHTPSAASTPPSSLTPTPSTSLSSLAAHANHQTRQLRQKKSSGFLGAIQRAMGAHKPVPAPLHSPVSAPLGTVVRNNGKDPLPRADPIPVALGIHCTRPDPRHVRGPTDSDQPVDSQPRTCVLAAQPLPQAAVRRASLRPLHRPLPAPAPQPQSHAGIRRASLRPLPRPLAPAAPQPADAPRVDLRPVSMAFSAGFSVEMLGEDARLSGRPDERADEQEEELVGRPEMVDRREMDEEVDEEEEEVTVRHVEKRILGMSRGGLGEVQKQQQQQGQGKCCEAARQENRALKEEIDMLKALLESERRGRTESGVTADAGRKSELRESSYFWKSPLSAGNLNSREEERMVPKVAIGIGGSECLLCGK